MILSLHRNSGFYFSLLKSTMYFTIVRIAPLVVGLGYVHVMCTLSSLLIQTMFLEQFIDIHNCYFRFHSHS